VIYLFILAVFFLMVNCLLLAFYAKLEMGM